MVGIADVSAGFLVRARLLVILHRTQASHNGVFWQVGQGMIDCPGFLPHIETLLIDVTAGKIGMCLSIVEFVLRVPDQQHKCCRWVASRFQRDKQGSFLLEIRLAVPCLEKCQQLCVRCNEFAAANCVF